MTGNPKLFLSRTGYREVNAGTSDVLAPGAHINGVLFTGAADISLDLTGPVTSTGNATAISNSVALPGSPTTTTQSPATNNTTLATTAYVDAAVIASAVGVFTFKGVIDASGNPNYPAAAIGDTYKISVAGKIGGASGAVVSAGDTVYCYVANGGGTQAAVGNDFVIIEVDDSGEVIGPSGAGNNHVALFDGTTGYLIKDSGLTLSPYDVTSDVTTTTGGIQITNIMSMTAAAYALITPNASTLYFING